MIEKFKKEIESFQNLWNGGFFIENSPKRNQIELENYLIKNLDQNLTILEIGCGRGRWSKFINENIKPKKLICVDVLSSEHNNFWSYVGNKNNDNIEYYHIDDFSLKNIDDDSIDFVFSYDVWCHISLSSQELYLKSLYKKCKKNGKLLIMYADAKKYLESEPENTFFVKEYLPKIKLENIKDNSELIKVATEDSDGEIIEGRWYWVGKDKFIENVKKYGFEILIEDIEIDMTNIITKFQKV